MDASNQTTTWSFATHGSLAKEVEKRFPQEAHRWPLLRYFNFEGHVWRSTHLVVILRDKLSGIPVGGATDTVPESAAPIEPPNVANLATWQTFLRSHYNVREQDAALLVPLVSDSQKVEEQWAVWDEVDKQLWHRQIEFNILRHFYHIKRFDMAGRFFLPPGYLFLADDCARFFKDHPVYDKNVFIMTRFVPGNRLLEKLDTELRAVLRSHGLNPVRADDRMYLRDRNLWNNVCVYMHCCSVGIAILEDRVADEFNPNVALEYGFMRALNKPVLLLADVGFRNLRADIIGTLREQFDITNIKGSIAAPVMRWISELGIEAG